MENLPSSTKAGKFSCKLDGKTVMPASMQHLSVTYTVKWTVHARMSYQLRTSRIWSLGNMCVIDMYIDWLIDSLSQSNETFWATETSKLANEKNDKN